MIKTWYLKWMFSIDLFSENTGTPLTLPVLGSCPGPPGSLACCWSPVAPPAVAAGQPARPAWPRLAPPECDGCNNSDTVRERCCHVNTSHHSKVGPYHTPCHIRAIISVFRDNFRILKNVVWDLEWDRDESSSTSFKRKWDIIKVLNRFLWSLPNLNEISWKTFLM